MRNSRLAALIRKEFIQVIRDPRALAVTFILPIMMLLLLGYAATNDVRNVALGVWDQDNSPDSRTRLRHIRLRITSSWNTGWARRRNSAP